MDGGTIWLGMFEFLEASDRKIACFYVGPFENTSRLLISAEEERLFFKSFKKPFF